MNLPALADQLLPFLLPLLRQSAQGGGSSAQLAQHELGGGLHVGVLSDSQAPQFLKMDGSRELTGNLSVVSGAQIDGVDLSAHAADPAAHHAPVTAGTLLSLSGQQVSVAAGAPYQFIGTGGGTAAGWRSVSELAGAGLTAANGVLAVGVAGLGLSVGADAVALASSSNPGAAASVLATDASGYLSLVRLRTPLIDTTSGDLALSPATGITSLSALHASTRVRSPLLDTAAGNLAVSPAADLVLSPGGNLVRLAASRALQSDGYASQTTGMRITHAGEGDFRYLFTDELHAKSFIADLEQALAGGQIISKSVAVLATAFTAPAAGGTATLTVRDLPSAPDMACFVSGDIVRLRQFSRAAGSLSIADCWGVVTGYADNAGGTQSWTFTRSSAPNAGAMTAGTVVQPDAIVLDYGTTGNGFYEVNAIDGAYGLNSPYAQIVNWATHPATGQTVRSRLGNLRGIFGAANEYGLFAGAGTAVSDAYLRISNTEVGLYNLPLRMYTGGTERVHIGAHNDVWIGPSSADKRLSWDGSTLTVSGAINVTGGNAATLGNVTGASNLVLNASFESDSNADGLADGFVIYNNDGGAVPTVASRVAGEKSAWAQRIAWTGTNASTKGIAFNTGTRRASTDYVISFWARTSTATGLTPAWNHAPASAVALLWPTAGTTWQFYAMRLQWSSATGDSWYISISNGAAIANGWIEFDNVQVVEGSEIVPWALAPADKADVSLGNSVISTLISGANIRVGSGVKDSTLNGWNIDAAEIVGQAAGIDQVVMDTSGAITAGAGTAAINRYGYLIADVDISGGATWPFVYGGLHSVANVGSPTTNYRGSLMFGTPLGVYANLPNVWFLRYPGTLPVYTPVGGGASLSNALMLSDDSGYGPWVFWHSGNDGSGSGLDADLFRGMGVSTTGAHYAGIPLVSGDGVMEVGRYIDFHESHGNTSDFSARIASNGGVLSASGIFYATTLRAGNGSDLYSAKIQTDGNVHAVGAITSQWMFQVQAQATVPGGAAGYARITLRASDNALVAIMPSGAVRVLATN